MSELIGQVLSVDTHNIGENLVSAAAVGETVLHLVDASPFFGTSGVCIIDGSAYEFLDVDVEEDTLTLATPLPLGLEADSLVEVFPATPEKYALVALGDEGEAVPVLVPHALVELLPDGIRDPLDQETVAVDIGGYELSIVDVLGKRLATGVVATERLTPELLALIRMRFDDEAQRDDLVPSPSEGMSSYLLSTGLEYIYSGGQWAPLSVYVKKASNTAVTSSTALIDDPHLWVDLVPGTYRVELFVHGTSSTAGDIKVAWSYSNGPIVTGNRAVRGMSVQGQDGAAATTRTTGHFIETEVAYGFENTGTVTLAEDILLRVNTSGRMQMRWSQNASSSTATVVSAASRIYVTRLADRT